MARQNLEAGENTGVFRQKLNNNFLELYSNASIDTGVRSLTSNYNSTFTTVRANSATWNYQGTDIKSLTGNYNSTFTTVRANSATWNYQGTDIKSLTGNWDSTSTTVRANSANWDSTSTTVNSNSANWILEDLTVSCSDEVTDLVVNSSILTFRVPFAMYLNTIRASVNVAPVGSAISIDVSENGSSILSTPLTIDENEKTSTTAAVPVVISDRNLLDDAEIIVNLSQVGTFTAGKGLKLTFKGYRII